MLNEEKVKNMTKAASYEEGEHKSNIRITEYYRTDYIGLQMVKSAVAYTAAFLILAVLFAFGRMEELMLAMSRADDLQRMLKVLLLFFVLGLLFYEVCIYTYYSWKYQCAKQSVGDYQTYLKNIHRYYEQENVEDDYTEIALTDEETDL